MTSELIRATEEYQRKIAEKQRENDEILAKIRTNEYQLRTVSLLSNYVSSSSKQRTGNTLTLEAQLLHQTNTIDILMKRLQLLDKWERVTSLSDASIDQTCNDILHRHDGPTMNILQLYRQHCQNDVQDQLQYSQILEQYKHEIHEMEKNLAEIQTMITNKETLHNEQTDRINECNEYIRNLRDHNTTISTKLESVQTKLQNLTNEKDDILKRTKTIKQEIVNRNDELAKLQNHIQSLRQQIQQKELQEHQRMVLENQQKYRQATVPSVSTITNTPNTIATNGNATKSGTKR